ncbi:hypothetical protein [Bacillus pumilus]|uniref:hypothetical protein n=1 Tax=Bacillus pumilus TaxID=1408 RepID=UPI00119F46A9|nr:hypothetical protein [Bacillus pumilus]
MYFITEPSDLIGKEVGFIHANQFCDATTIVSKDGGVLVVKQESDSDWDCTTVVLNEYRAKKYIYESKYMKEELNKLGIITKKDWEDYEKELKRIEEDSMKRFRKERDEMDRKKYEELKARFEPEKNS